MADFKTNAHNVSNFLAYSANSAKGAALPAKKCCDVATKQGRYIGIALYNFIAVSYPKCAFVPGLSLFNS